MDELLMAGGDRKYLLSGNEAIVRGALEGNVRFVAGYPGTPSSEIIDRFSCWRRKLKCTSNIPSTRKFRTPVRRP